MPSDLSLTTYSHEQVKLLAELYPKPSVDDEHDLGLAAEALNIIRAWVKRIEDARTALVKPLNDHVAWINGQFRELTEPVKGADLRIKALMSQYRTRLEQERQAEIRRREEAARANVNVETGELPPVTVVPAAPTTIQTPTGGATFRTIWKWEVVDMEKVPRMFLAVDPGKLTAAVRQGVRDIPGVRIYSEEVPATSRGY